MRSRQPYTGETRKLVVALDVGTTFSGVSYCLLDPGQVPEIQGVTRFPFQELANADSKIPSIVLYDRNGNVRAVGAAALHGPIQEDSLIENWTKAHWFKLHLKPTHLHMDSVVNLPPLPPGKSAIDVFADYLQYLYDCTGKFIGERHPNGRQMWLSAQSTVDIILSHPNGWEGPQQDQMRQAAIQARIVPNVQEGRQRIHFVTEGEASLHFCISNNLNTESMKRGGRILVIDAGGGTIDMSSYGRRTENGKQFYEELSPAQCKFNGSIFVTENAKKYLRKLLKGSRFFEMVQHITECFDKTTKPTFQRKDESSFIKFGTPQDREPNLNINYGQLKLPGTKVAEFFQPSVDCIVDAILGHRRYLNVSTVFLVGGFAASDWLYSSIISGVASNGISVCRPDSQINKVVANGAVSFFLDHHVSSRVSKYVYGVEVAQTYSEKNREHIRRKLTCFNQPSGKVSVPGAFTVILPQDIKVKEQAEFRQAYEIELAETDEMTIIESIYCYRGTKKFKWIDEDPDHLDFLCKVQADLSKMVTSQTAVKGPTGISYYTLNYDIIILFGLTELAVQIAWKEKGREKRGPARIVYDAE